MHLTFVGCANGQTFRKQKSDGVKSDSVYVTTFVFVAEKVLPCVCLIRLQPMPFVQKVCTKSECVYEALESIFVFHRVQH